MAGARDVVNLFDVDYNVCYISIFKNVLKNLRCSAKIYNMYSER